METKNLSILKALNLSSEVKPQIHEDDFTTGYTLIIISIAIIIGNCLVLWTVKSFSKRLVADIFIFSLALLDITHTMSSILLAIVFKWTYLENKEFGVLCKIQAWFTVTTQADSAFIVTLINVERLTAVTRPFFYKTYVNTRRAVKSLVILLFISILVGSLPLVAWGNYVLLPKMALCIFSHDSDYAIFILAIGYADLFVVSYCFLAIKISLKKFMKRQARFVARRGAIVDLQARGVALTKTASMSFIQSQRMIKVTAMVSGLFYFSWLPLMISITRAQVTSEPNHLLTLISTLQPLASPLANPLIYFFTWERYKKSYIRICKRIISCLAFTGAAMFNRGSDSAISRSVASQVNLSETKSNKRARNQNDKILVNIASEMTHSGQSDLYSMSSVNNNKWFIPTGGKPRSFSYDSSMSFRCLTSQYAETKRRPSFIAESMTVRKEVLSEEKLQIENELKNVEEVSRNGTKKSEHKNSFSTRILNCKSRKLAKPKLSQTLSSTNQHKIEKYGEVNYVDDMVNHDEVSLEETCRLKHVPYCSVAGNTIAKRDDSQNLTDKCLITQRINQYLTNVVNDEDLQLSQKRRRTTAKQLEHTKRKCHGSGSISQKTREYSCSNHMQKGRNTCRQKPRQFCSRNRHKYSRKHYLEEFEDFRNNLDDDVRHKLEEKHKETRKVEDNFLETFDSHKLCNEAQGKRRDQFIIRIFPKSDEFTRRGIKSPEIPQRGHLHHSRKTINLRKGLELNRVNQTTVSSTKSKHTETSIWSYL